MADLYRKPAEQRGEGHASKLAPASVDDILHKHALAQFRRDPAGKAKPSGTGAGAKDTIADADLIASMAKRLTVLESNLRDRNNLLQKAQADNEALRSKLKTLEEEVANRALAAVEGASAEGASHSPESAAVTHLRAENARLRGQVALAWKQVADMKAFLNDYGMVWVGEPSTDGSPPGGSEGQQRQASPALRQQPGGQVVQPQGPSDGGAWWHPSTAATQSGTTSNTEGQGQGQYMMGKGYRLGGGTGGGTAAPAGPAGGQDPTFASSAAGPRSATSSRPASAGATSSPTTPVPQLPGAPVAPVTGGGGSAAVSSGNGAGRPPSSPPAGQQQHQAGNTSPLMPLPPRPPPGPERSSAGPGRVSVTGEEGGLGPSGGSNGTRVGSGGLRRRTYTGGPSGTQPGGSGGAGAGVVQGASNSSTAVGGATGTGTGGDGSTHGAPASPAAAGGVASPTSGSNPPGARSPAPPPLLQPAWSPPPPQPPPSSSVLSPNSERLPFRMSDLLARVEELNQLAGDGCGQLVPSKGAGAGGLQAHVLHTPDPVRLSVFKDGLQLHRWQARPYSDPSSDAVLRDILDGYFPGPLRTEFPDGVPIKVVDRTRESYKDALAPVQHPALRGAGGAPGAGGSGGGNVRTFHDLESADAAPMSRDKFLAKLPQAVIRNGKVVDVAGSMCNAVGVPKSQICSKYMLLRRNGKVIDVRGGVAKAMGGGGAGGLGDDKPQVSVVHTPVGALLTTSQRNHVGPVLPPPSREGGYRPPGAGGTSVSNTSGGGLLGQLSSRDPLVGGAGGLQGGSHKAAEGSGSGAGSSVTTSSTAAAGTAAQGAVPVPPEITTLQVKSEDGSHTFIVKLQYDDTIGALRKYIDAHRSKSKEGPRGTKYEIRTAFPPRAYDDFNETLRAAGLIPNATLFLRAPSTTT